MDKEIHHSVELQHIERNENIELEILTSVLAIGLKFQTKCQIADRIVSFSKSMNLDSAKTSYSLLLFTISLKTYTRSLVLNIAYYEIMFVPFPD